MNGLWRVYLILWSAPGGKILDRHSDACDPLELKRAIVDYLGRTYK